MSPSDKKLVFSKVIIAFVTPILKPVYQNHRTKRSSGSFLKDLYSIFGLPEEISIFQKPSSLYLKLVRTGLVMNVCIQLLGVYINILGATLVTVALGRNRFPLVQHENEVTYRNCSLTKEKS